MAGNRRFGLYFAWSRPGEAGKTPGAASGLLKVLNNRYPTLFEFRRALLHERSEWAVSEQLGQETDQSITGFLDHVVLSDFRAFEDAIREQTGQEVGVVQRVEGSGPKQLDDSFFSTIDTLIVVSLDHLRTRQVATPGELEAFRAFLQREGSCAVVCPHHDIGTNGQLPDQQVEYFHHGDATIPPQQRIGGFARSLLGGLGLEVENRFGLNPAAQPDGEPEALTLFRDHDADGVLTGVRTFNIHPHLPHLHVGPGSAKSVDILARQKINPDPNRPHPFREEGHAEFNALLRCRPEGIAGSLYVCDATLWSSAFRGLDSLRAFWANLARLRL
jgi:hypothetical protein